MIKAVQSPSTTYLQFSRRQWAKLRNSMSSVLTEAEILKLKEINSDLSLTEVNDIYLPLSSLLNFYIGFNRRKQAIIQQLQGTKPHCNTYIIGITGSVAVGKSTTARILQTLLSCWPEHPTVELVTTDGFLHSNKILKQRNLMRKKGFPESYDNKSLLNFIIKIKLGMPYVTAPVYSHLIYDIIPNKQKIIAQPDILILEGLNILQTPDNNKHGLDHAILSNFVDFSIYIDAPETLLQSWYVNRFLKFRQKAFSDSDSDSYFSHYSHFAVQEAINIASELWNEVNRQNLRQNILPTRERASLILDKSNDHIVERIQLYKSNYLVTMAIDPYLHLLSIFT